MMRRHDVFALPRRYRAVQQAACAQVGERLGVAGLAPADVVLLGVAPEPADPSPLVASVLRGTGGERVVRLCLTPAMTVLIDPALAPGTGRSRAMKLDTLRLLVERDEIHAFVDGLWSDGPFRRSHREGGLVHRVVDRFAQIPRLFYQPSETQIEWTHFSAWWGAILLCDYDNPVIRDLRYLHEMYHAATIPHVAGMNSATMAQRNFHNEREASTFTEVAIYLEFPELRATASTTRSSPTASCSPRAT